MSEFRFHVEDDGNLQMTTSLPAAFRQDLIRKAQDDRVTAGEAVLRLFKLKLVRDLYRHGADYPR